MAATYRAATSATTERSTDPSDDGLRQKLAAMPGGRQQQHREDPAEERDGQRAHEGQRGGEVGRPGGDEGLQSEERAAHRRERDRAAGRSVRRRSPDGSPDETWSLRLARRQPLADLVRQPERAVDRADAEARG